jgi:hypothetical protein
VNMAKRHSTRGSNRADSRSSEEIVLLRLEVKSTNPNVDTAVLLEDMANKQPQLEVIIRKHALVQSVSLRRQGNLPIGLETAVISLVANLGAEMAKEVLKEVAKDAYVWIKGQWKNAKFTKLRSTSVATRKSKLHQERTPARKRRLTGRTDA